MAQSADKAYAEPIHQRLFLYFDTSRLQAAFGLVDPPTSGSGLFRVTLHLRFPRLPGGGAVRGGAIQALGSSWLASPVGVESSLPNKDKGIRSPHGWGCSLPQTTDYSGWSKT